MNIEQLLLSSQHKTKEKRSPKLLQFYSIVVSYLLKTFVADIAIADYDVIPLWFVQSATMTCSSMPTTLLQCFAGVAHVYDKDIIFKTVWKLSPFLPDKVSTTIGQLTLQILSDIALQGESLLAIQKKFPECPYDKSLTKKIEWQWFNR